MPVKLGAQAKKQILYQHISMYIVREKYLDTGHVEKFILRVDCSSWVDLSVHVMEADI